VKVNGKLCYLDTGVGHVGATLAKRARPTIS
jgi:hypothetical protein